MDIIEILRNDYGFILMTKWNESDVDYDKRM
jgi:hypothetical protein